MKLSKKTLGILRNFANINESILFVPGNTIKTVSPGQTKDFYARATIDEELPTECAIFNLKKFKSCAELFQSPDFDFREKFVVISDGKSSFRYGYCGQGDFDAADYTRTTSVKNPHVTFTLTADQIKMAIDSAALLDIEDVQICGDGGKITMTALDDDHASSDIFSVLIAEDADCDDFVSKYNIEKLRRLYEGVDYEVTIGKAVVTEFKSEFVTYHTGGEIIIKG